MSEQLKYCMGCMESIPYDTVVCPVCGYNEETVQPAPYLEPGSLIMRKYLVGRVLSVAPDAIIYIGANIENGATVEVVEFYPQHIVTRNEGETEPTIKLGYDTMFSNCLQSFLNLWRGLDIFKDSPCLPDVLDVVDFNGTVYAVYERKDCITLRQYLQENGALTWARAISAFTPLMHALNKLNYAGIVHGALSPDTVLVGSDGRLHITGFSIPQCNSGIAEFSSKPAEGFAPIEIYDTSGATGKTDVYSVTALLYYSITLTPPPEATLRIVKDTTTLPAAVANTLSKGVIDGLILGLSVYPENRIGSFDELISVFAPACSAENSEPEIHRQAAPQPKNLTQKEEIDLEIAKELELQEKLRQEKRDTSSSVASAVKGFIAGFVLCAIFFCGLYGTFIYKNYPIDFMDTLLSPFSFLPLNKQPTTTMPSTTVPVPTEPKYVTVADFVTSHTLDSIRSNSVFTEQYKFNFVFEESTQHPKDTIISQNIEPGASVPAGTEITLVVSKGTTKIRLPDNLVGVNYMLVEEALKTAGFQVKYKLLANDGKHTVGEVFSIDKKAGELYEKGTVITLSIWNKVTQTTAPSTTAAASTTKPATTTQAAAAQ